MSGQFAARIPNCSDRYRLVGVLPLRDTPTRITSAVLRSVDEAPSSCARAKLIASMRWVYPFASRVLCERPTVCVDFAPNSASSGSRKLSKKSSTKASALRIVSRISALTSVVKTTGRPFPAAEASSIRLTQAWAFSTESMKGTVIWSNRMPSNCVSRLWPSISTVIPVPSETKNTVRRGSGMKRGQPGDFGCARRALHEKKRFKDNPPTATKTGFRARLKYAVNSARLGMGNMERVGEKNAPRGEMIGQLPQRGTGVPGGFAPPADAFREFL